MAIFALVCILCHGYRFFLSQPVPSLTVINLALAYRCCSISGYSQQDWSGSADEGFSLASELRRRCFWACWTSVCVAGEPTPYVRASWQEASMVALPAQITASASGWKVQGSGRMDENWSPVLLDPQHDTGTIPTVAATLMKMVGIW